MAVFKRGGIWWCEFTFAGRRIRESAKTSRKTIAGEAEKRHRLRLERAYAGLPVDAPSARINTVLDCTKAYRKAYEQGHREKSKKWVAERLKKVESALGNVILPDLTEERIRSYMAARKAEGVGGRTINMEVSMLACAIGNKWSNLWPKVRRNEEPKDSGRALTQEEEQRLLKAVGQARSPVLETLVRVLLLTAMRSGEVTSMTWGQVDFEHRIVTVGRSKTDAGAGRQIPMNQELFDALTHHARWFTKRFGETRPEHYVFPSGERWPSNPWMPAKSFKTAWGSLRAAAGVRCRIHDLRHTAITKLAESGASDSTIMSIAGHLSRAMLERYSHIRMNAKREAVKAMTLEPQGASPAGVPTISPTVAADSSPS
jgi:integrase